MLTKEDNDLVLSKYNELIGSCKFCQNQDTLKLINDAFEFAHKAHGSMRRKSGEPFIIHPIEVAKIAVNEIGLGPISIVCSLLHDVVEDTNFTIEEMEKKFGAQASQIIDGLTKIPDVYNNKAEFQAENLRRILLTIPENIHVIYIKLADRLHNLRTMDSMPPHKQKKKANETLYVYAPLAKKLGLYGIKNELEDLSFKFRYPKEFQNLAEIIREKQKKFKTIFSTFEQQIYDTLHKTTHYFRLIPKNRSIFSTWQEMQKRSCSFDEVRNYFSIRIVFEANNGADLKGECYKIYTAITNVFYPKPGSLNDESLYSNNIYKALHATVMGPHNDWLGIQILTNEMNEIAQKGYLFSNKDKNGNVSIEASNSLIQTIKDYLASDEVSALELFDDVRHSLFSSEIYIFTPTGQIKTMAKGATVLDFAFELHSDLGFHCIGAKINHEHVGKRHTLDSGDQVEILTSENQVPKLEWLDIVQTAKAKTKLKSLFKEKRVKFIEKGQEILTKITKENNIKLNTETLKKLSQSIHFLNKDDLYYKIGKNTITKEDINKAFKISIKIEKVDYPRLQVTRSKGFIDKNKKDLNSLSKKSENEAIKILSGNDYVLAKCCNPIPGDEVMGYELHDNTIMIHKTNCSKAISLVASGFNIQVDWVSSQISSFLTKIRVKGRDRMRMVNDITNVISNDLDVNMKALNINSENGIFFGTIDLYVFNLNHLNNLINKINSIKGVTKTYRVENWDSNMNIEQMFS